MAIIWNPPSRLPDHPQGDGCAPWVFIGVVVLVLSADIYCAGHHWGWN